METIKDVSKLYHVPLEPYQARYTELLSHWEKTAFDRHFDRVLQFEGPVHLPEIRAGRVLDSYSRVIWSLDQFSFLLDQLYRNTQAEASPIYFSDFFTPGLECLAYSGFPLGRVGSFCWAQTFDEFDFTAEFSHWMRPWEWMAFNIYTDIFIACSELLSCIYAAFPLLQFRPKEMTPRLHVVGLPFSSGNVYSLLGKEPLKYPDRPLDVIYTSRFDKEKNPSVFLDLVESMPGQRFAISTGHPQLKGTDIDSVQRALKLVDEKRILLQVNATKIQYYELLAQSKVQFNCSSQDWISFTLLEALTFGCAPLYPMHRSFPGALLYNPLHLYPPFYLDTIREMIRFLSNSAYGIDNDWRMAILEYHDGTLDRIGKCLKEPLT